MNPTNEATEQPQVAQPKASPAFPIIVKSGGTSVRIYRTPTTVRGTKYLAFTVDWTAGGARKRKVFSDLDRAKKHAKAVADEKERGEIAVAAISAEDRVRLADALRELSAATGVGSSGFARLTEIVRDYTAATKLLPPGANLCEAVKYYATRHPSNAPDKTVAAVVAELIDDRRAAGCSEAHLADLKKRLGRFGTAFQMPIGHVSGPMVREYLRNLRSAKGEAITNRSRRNDQRAITSLFHFAKSQKYISRDGLDDITEIPAPKVEAPEVGIFTPQEIAKILHAAPDDILPCLLLGAFCGLRLAELQRLEWSAVRLSQGVIILDAGMTKTAARRVIPISENLSEWLLPLVKASGRVSPAPTDRALNHRFARTAARVKVGWVRNGLRHSFCSYRLAVTHDPARVAMEAGNSPAMLFRHYRELVTEAQGKEWFAVRPARTQGAVIAFPNPEASKPAQPEAAQPACPAAEVAEA